MTVEELLAEHGVDPAALDPAPAKPDRHQRLARYPLLLERQCSACGAPPLGYTVVAVTFPEAGPRWVHLCRECSRATREPWRGPTTVEGILADFREVVAEVAAERGMVLRVRVWTDEDGWQDETHG